jgi:hypothetical protein
VDFHSVGRILPSLAAQVTPTDNTVTVLMQCDMRSTMKRGRWKTVAVALLAWSSMAQAAGTFPTRGNSAGMEVGLRIVEACAIVTRGGAGASVDCKHDTPYSIEPDANAPAGATVLTVAF